MTISVLVCKPDGTQFLEEREVSDQYFQVDPPSTDADAQSPSEE